MSSPVAASCQHRALARVRRLRQPDGAKPQMPVRDPGEPFVGDGGREQLGDAVVAGRARGGERGRGARRGRRWACRRRGSRARRGWRPGTRRWCGRRRPPTCAAPGPGPAAASARVGCVGDHLGEQRVVVGRHHAARPEPGVDPDPLPFWQPLRHRSPMSKPVRCPWRAASPAAGSSATRRTSMAWPVEAHVVLADRERFAGGDAQLELDQVEAGDRLGDGVLDLEAGVDLEEGDRRLSVSAHRPGTRPCRRCGSRRGGPGRARRRTAWRGCASSMPGDGDSSTTFWLRRWIEHSRSPRWTTLPWASPRICTSTWRPRSM